MVACFSEKSNHWAKVFLSFEPKGGRRPFSNQATSSQLEFIVCGPIGMCQIIGVEAVAVKGEKNGTQLKNEPHKPLPLFLVRLLQAGLRQRHGVCLAAAHGWRCGKHELGSVAQGSARMSLEPLDFPDRFLAAVDPAKSCSLFVGFRGKFQQMSQKDEV